NEPDLPARKHPRIRRSVRFVAARAALEPYWRVFKRERSPLIAVAAKAAWFVAGERLHHARTEASMGIMTIDARHGAFGKPMLERLLELTPDACMATRALFIDGRRVARYQASGAVRVDRMT